MRLLGNSNKLSIKMTCDDFHINGSHITQWSNDYFKSLVLNKI